ncbi:hypothetical protein KIW84_010934 [Lathyrus oleraceus]|uniref:DUF7745 domain-containing protein n=1 Tax=Pisum sativum TaxID=3888 RepID=A0A9D4YL60_PEA|nr:hypothetical protein KIW84_010934 [Pisum sativum]
MSLLPASGPFVDTQSTLKWTQRVMSLTSYDIRWQSYRMDVKDVIMSCGEFRNVPLVGTKGCINYNPVLSLRQLGFVMSRRPLEAEIAESVCFEKKDDPVRLEQIGKAWRSLGVRDGSVLGKKFAIAMPDYTDWVKKRVETLLLPYDRMEPLQVQPPLVLADSVPAEHYKQALMESRRLREKEQDIQMELYKAKADKLHLAHQLREVQGEDASRARKKDQRLGEATQRQRHSVEERDGVETEIRGLSWRRSLGAQKTVEGEDHPSTRMFRMLTVDRPVPLSEDPHSGRPIADQRPHRYSTRLNHQRNMDQVQAELAEMRANMAQFMTMMQGVVQGQEELRALAQRLEAVIPPVHRAPPVDVPVHENAAVTILVDDCAVSDELKGIRISEQPLAAETVNVRATCAPVSVAGRYPHPQQCTFVHSTVASLLPSELPCPPLVELYCWLPSS